MNDQEFLRAVQEVLKPEFLKKNEDSVVVYDVDGLVLYLTNETLIVSVRERRKESEEEEE